MKINWKDEPSFELDIIEAKEYQNQMRGHSYSVISKVYENALNFTYTEFPLMIKKIEGPRMYLIDVFKDLSADLISQKVQHWLNHKEVIVLYLTKDEVQERYFTLLV